MAGFSIEFEFDDGAMVEIDNGRVRFWKAYGLPDFIGDLECFAEENPIYMQHLINHGIVRNK